jgi:hypothetical protein
MTASTTVRGVTWTARLIVVITASAQIAAQAPPPTPSRPAVMSPDARVRGTTSRVIGLVTEGTARSKTFRGLVEAIGETDGLVYIGEGSCGHEVQACLLFSMTKTPANRVLRILIDPSRSEEDLVGAVAHELQHAYEVLSVRSVQTDAAMTLLYRRIGRLIGRRYETDAAIKVGDAVRAEFRDSETATQR